MSWGHISAYRPDNLPYVLGNCIIFFAENRSRLCTIHQVTATGSTYRYMLKFGDDYFNATHHEITMGIKFMDMFGDLCKL